MMHEVTAAATFSIPTGSGTYELEIPLEAKRGKLTQIWMDHTSDATDPTVHIVSKTGVVVANAKLPASGHVCTIDCSLATVTGTVIESLDPAVVFENIDTTTTRSLYMIAAKGTASVWTVSLGYEYDPNVT